MRHVTNALTRPHALIQGVALPVLGAAIVIVGVLWFSRRKRR